MEPKEIRYEEPKIEVIHLAETDIITTSGWNSVVEMEEYPDK